MKVLDKEKKEIEIDFVKISEEKLYKLNDILLQSPYQFSNPIVLLLQECIYDTIKDKNLAGEDANNFGDKKG